MKDAVLRVKSSGVKSSDVNSGGATGWRADHSNRNDRRKRRKRRKRRDHAGRCNRCNRRNRRKLRGAPVSEDLEPQHVARDEQPPLELRLLLHRAEGVGHHGHQQSHQQDDAYNREHEVDRSEDQEGEPLPRREILCERSTISNKQSAMDNQQ